MTGDLTGAFVHFFFQVPAFRWAEVGILFLVFVLFGRSLFSVFVVVISARYLPLRLFFFWMDSRYDEQS